MLDTTLREPDLFILSTDGPEPRSGPNEAFVLMLCSGVRWTDSHASASHQAILLLQRISVHKLGIEVLDLGDEKVVDRCWSCPSAKTWPDMLRELGGSDLPTIEIDSSANSRSMAGSFELHSGGGYIAIVCVPLYDLSLRIQTFTGKNSPCAPISNHYPAIPLRAKGDHRLCCLQQRPSSVGLLH